MAENQTDNPDRLSENLLQDIKRLIWGENVHDDVFRRWSQGFIFSADEPTALIQFDGGPCAILAPVQAFLLKHAVFGGNSNWRKATAEESTYYLRKAMAEILSQSRQINGVFYLVTENDSEIEPNLDINSFHTSLRVRPIETIEEVEGVYLSEFDCFQRSYAVLLFLYSIVLTKGIEQIKNEQSDPSEPLIDLTHGYGSQSLINLMLTGCAVSHVWDNERNISGLLLRGVTSQSTIGFLTILEHLHYCEVGWYLKCPSNPIWVLGSETHLTVLFSEELSLVGAETSDMAARRIFKRYDPEGNNFISAVLLKDVLSDLDLVSEPEYVEIMKKKLDADNLGIILLNNFMDEFFPNFVKPSGPDTFSLFHYNGLRRSCPNNKIRYQEGSAILLECDITCVLDSNPLQTCLQTKWPSIEVQWASGIHPSLN